METSRGPSQLARFGRQAVISAPRPKRAEVLQLEVEDPPRLRGTLSIWRNHAIEPLLPLLEVFLKHSGICFEMAIGEYDDSLWFAPAEGSAAELIWFDLDRLNLDSHVISDWFVSRIDRVISMSSSPVVVVPVSRDPGLVNAVTGQIEKTLGAFCANPSTTCEGFGTPLIDERLSGPLGTRVSRDAQMQLARALGIHWLPAAVLPHHKLIALDLDGTLHQGVLGDDGINGIEVSPAHRRLQDFLKKLTRDGIMLALVSRNDRQLVETLFAERQPDYGLSLSDFAAIEVSWGSKADAIRQIAAFTRISEDSVVFVDDNAGELLTVALSCPTVALIHASSDANCTLDAIRWQSGLWRWTSDSVSDIRTADLKANIERERLLDEANNLDRYLEELGAELKLNFNPTEDIQRLSDLSLKTNQFNLNQLRLSVSDIATRMQRPDSFVISIALKDRISDSGIIALVSGQWLGKLVVVDELIISCRALGRGLESIILIQALRKLKFWESVTHVTFRFQTTERNLPARSWLATLVEDGNQQLSSGEIVVSVEALNRIIVPNSVATLVIDQDKESC